MSQNIKVIFHEPDFQAAVDIIVQDDAQNTERLLRQLVVVRADTGAGFLRWMESVYMGSVPEHLANLATDDPVRFVSLHTLSRAETDRGVDYILQQSDSQHQPSTPSFALPNSWLAELRFPTFSDQQDNQRASLQDVGADVVKAILAGDPDASPDEKSFDRELTKLFKRLKECLKNPLFYSQESTAALMTFLTTKNASENTPLDQLVESPIPSRWKEIITCLPVDNIAQLLKTKDDYQQTALDRLTYNIDFFPKFVAMLWYDQIAGLFEHGIVIHPAPPSESMIKMQQLINVARQRDERS